MLAEIMMRTDILTQFVKLHVFNQLWLSFFLLIPLVLISRSVVAGTKYSPILPIVVFGLAMGYVLVSSGVCTPGLPQFLGIDLISQTITVALIASFFVGGQELRKVFGRTKIEEDESEIPSREELSVGTNRAQMVHIIRAFFLLLGIITAYRAIVGLNRDDDTSKYYPLIAYIGLVCSTILMDRKAIIQDKKYYVRRGALETVGIIFVLIGTFYVASWIEATIALPQIFFAMLATCGLGALFHKWRLGPTLKSLLFAGLPIVLAANFMIGGSKIAEAFAITDMNSVLAFGFFGQIVWMFGGIALLMLFAKTSHVRNLAPALAGGLSHAGLTGACTAGDLGGVAASRAPIMINLPFAAHIFVFSILAVSAKNKVLFFWPAMAVFAAGIILTYLSLRAIKKSDEQDSKEVKGLMKFALGWQIAAIFGGFILLSCFNMPLHYVAVSVTSSLSHFGLFAATQGGMFGRDVADMLPFIFAMPFLVHPFVFFLFGRAMEKGGHMPRMPVFVLVGIGLIGVIYALMAIKAKLPV
ncbi:MAG: hypothetical protein FWD53_06405 [Phycisphaerales bacterium]|nr:hypothetical protein [Phycisphaerales bacterium]